MTTLVTKTSLQALRDIHRNFLNAIYGTKWMRQQIRKGGVDKRVSFIESNRRRNSVLDAINSLNDTMNLTSCYYGYINQRITPYIHFMPIRLKILLMLS